MMETTVSVVRVAAFAAWLSVAGLMGAAWVVGMWGSWEVSVLLALTAGALAPFAALIHARCYFSKMAELIRVSGSEPARVRSVR